jgi:molybdenum cofactor synthesis domain-containing protein
MPSFFQNPAERVGLGCEMPTYNAAVLTISDRCAAGEREDKSGPLCAELLQAMGFCVAATAIVPDEAPQIAEEIVRLSRQAQLVVTTGGTGVAARDITPEATRSVLNREMPGLAEMIRAVGLAKTPLAAIHRGVSGLLGNVVVVNLSGSPKAVREQLEALKPVLPHVVASAQGDCPG